MAITNGYCSLSELKASLRITDDIDDALLELCIESASRDIDGSCERVFYQDVDATRVFVPTDAFLVETDDIVSITSVKTSPSGSGFTQTWSATDYQEEPLNGQAGGIVSPTTRLRAVGQYVFPVFNPSNVNSQEATVQVVGTFGWSAVPTAIKQATIIQAQRHFKRYDSPLGIAGFSDLGAVTVRSVDPDVRALIAPFKKVRMA